MRKKKHLFTTEGHPILIAKKGKHKIYIDTVTSRIIAINPLPLLDYAKRVGRSAIRETPYGETLTTALGVDISEQEQQQPPPVIVSKRSSFDKALALEALESRHKRRCY